MYRAQQLELWKKQKPLPLPPPPTLQAIGKNLPVSLPGICQQSCSGSREGAGAEGEAGSTLSQEALPDAGCPHSCVLLLLRPGRCRGTASHQGATYVQIQCRWKNCRCTGVFYRFATCWSLLIYGGKHQCPFASSSHTGACIGPRKPQALPLCYSSIAQHAAGGF